MLSLTTLRQHRLDNFEALVGLSELYPDLFAQSERSLETWGPQFEEFLNNSRDWLLVMIDDYSWLEQQMTVIRSIAEKLGTDVTELEIDVQYRLEELGADWEPDYDDYFREYYSDQENNSDMPEIDALFQSLR